MISLLYEMFFYSLYFYWSYNANKLSRLCNRCNLNENSKPIKTNQIHSNVFKLINDFHKWSIPQFFSFSNVMIPVHLPKNFGRRTCAAARFYLTSVTLRHIAPFSEHLKQWRNQHAAKSAMQWHRSLIRRHTQILLFVGCPQLLSNSLHHQGRLQNKDIQSSPRVRLHIKFLE